MRVGIDVTPEIVGRTGVARYSRELVAALVAEDVSVRQFAFGRTTVAPRPGVKHISVPLRFLHPVWRLVGRPRPEAFVGDVDVIHSLDLIPPPTRRPLVATVHDLGPLTHPHLHTRRDTRLQAARLRMIRRGSVVIANSQATADAVTAAGVASERVVVAPLGCTPLIAPCGERRSVAGAYVLAVGELVPRKGFDVLIRAMADPGLAHYSVVLAGPSTPYGQELRRLASELDLGDRVRFLGVQTDSELAALYRHAVAVCVPSRVEGFGLPIVEALSLETPVIATDLPATREVAGGGAVFVRPEDVDGLATAIRRVGGDKGLRQRLAAAGVVRARAFTWSATARATIGAYERALAAGPRR